MASPVHRFLFSPPTSPNLSAAASPLLDDPVGTIRELLSPSVPQGGFVNYKPSAIAAEAEVATSSMGPGGFNSTRSYPSRYTRASSSRSAFVGAYELPRIPASVKTAMPLDVPSTTSRNDSSRGQRLHRRTNSVTNDIFRLEIAQTAGLNVSSRPIPSRSTLKRLALFFAVLASIYLFASSSLIGGKRLSVMNNGTMTPEAIRQELVGSPAIRPSSRYVGGKKITVKSSHGAPKVIVTQKISAAQAPPRAYRPISPTAPLTPERELLALQTYLLEDSLHTIAPSVNPNKPLDPVIMLGFAPRNENGWKELKGEADPVVVWDIGHAWTTPIYNLLAIYAILPAPRVLSLEDRSDGSTIQSILSRIVPGHVPSQALITIGGSPVDGYEELLRLHQDGLLYGMLERAGAVVDGQKEAEKIEMARRSRIRPLKMGRVDRR